MRGWDHVVFLGDYFLELAVRSFVKLVAEMVICRGILSRLSLEVED